MNPRFGFLFLVLISVLLGADTKCPRTCDVALGSYFVWEGANLSFVSQMFLLSSPDIIVSYNRGRVPNRDSVNSGIRINVPFSCDCIGDSFLGHTFQYQIKRGDTYDEIATKFYSGLTTVDMLQRFNTFNPLNLQENQILNVVVNCSCGDPDISRTYGLFVTYPIRSNDSWDKLRADTNVSLSLLQQYNQGVNFTPGNLVFIPGRDQSGNYPPLDISTGLAGGAIAGIIIGAVLGFLLVVGAIFIVIRKRKLKNSRLLVFSQELSSQDGRALAPGSLFDKSTESNGQGDGGIAAVTGITVDKSVEFSYEELAKATDNFSLANKIGEGGFGSVYYAELRGEKAAIKKMDMQATREFLAEIKVLTRVHHLNLVRLIGYCVENSLFLVYEYIENGNLSQHLRGTGRDPLPWPSRVQIALDSARGLEYIHEHTVPVYIHRDIKSANILIDKNFHGKVADFGLTKLTEVGNSSLPTRLVGTFGYMPPEYAQYGDVSPKIDVYAFGVVLYELISAKEAVVKTNKMSAINESKGLVALFEDVLNQPDAKENLYKLVDPRLEENYPLDSVFKMAQLAKACTHENPQLRPSMRSIVVALMTLSSATEDWDVGSFYENQALVNLMSGR
ncbi:chitin elicitor receptor kinase 1 [Cucumis melo var. makuwa]|uniref:non-specific serine/threonine protein kinase n=1 Tax=Cucumis melo var. makuwa TaxID=1194695 RepID=A0A5D3C793_CUCMM|nr:chitin elicitor receptor kinase 1 [Cucumis melo var. makuwa]TYK07124.1 chitin elicitor receptor kinase 1 [Cucumis melo var. makuwa]